MNTNGLVRMYDCLSTWERLPLIMAASLREDEAERQRLVRSAPKVCYRVPDHFGLAQAFQEVSNLHYMELQYLAALYFQGMWLAEWKDKQRARRLLDAALFFGYLFKVKLAGWRLFCARLQVDPEQLWSCLPGFDTLKQAEDLADAAAFSAEGANAYLRRGGREGTRAPTAEDVAASLEESLRARADWWG